MDRAVSPAPLPGPSLTLQGLYDNVQHVTWNEANTLCSQYVSPDSSQHPQDKLAQFLVVRLSVYMHKSVLIPLYSWRLWHRGRFAYSRYSFPDEGIQSEISSFFRSQQITSSKCWLTVGSASQTLAQRRTSTGLTSAFYRDKTNHPTTPYGNTTVNGKWRAQM